MTFPNYKARKTNLKWHEKWQINYKGKIIRLNGGSVWQGWERAGKGLCSCLLFSRCDISCPSCPMTAWLPASRLLNNPPSIMLETSPPTPWTRKRQGHRIWESSLCDGLPQDSLEILKHQFITHIEFAMKESPKRDQEENWKPCMAVGL